MELGKQYTNDGLGFSELLKAPVIPFSEFWFLYILFFYPCDLLFFPKSSWRKMENLFFVIGAQLKFMSLSIKIVENKR